MACCPLRFNYMLWRLKIFMGHRLKSLLLHIPSIALISICNFIFSIKSIIRWFYCIPGRDRSKILFDHLLFSISDKFRIVHGFTHHCLRKNWNWRHHLISGMQSNNIFRVKTCLQLKQAFRRITHRIILYSCHGWCEAINIIYDFLA